MKSKNARFWASTFYFGYFAALGIMGPYLLIYYQREEITIQLAGILLAVPTVLSLFVNPMWGGIGDFFKLTGKLLPLIQLLTIPAVIMISFSHAFLPILIAVILYGICWNPVSSLADHSVLSMLGEDSYDYGKMRIWGSISYGIVSLVGGIIVEHANIQWVFWLFAVFALVSAYASKRLPESNKIGLGDSYWSAIKNFSANPTWIAFLIGALFFGIGLNIQGDYFILDVKALGAGEALFGLSLTLSCLSEIPIFLASPYLLRRFKPRKMIVIAFLFLVIRLLLISFLKDYRWVLATQLMHGITFSLMYSAGVNYINDITPAGMGASAQGIFGAMLWGIGGAVGAVFGAQIFAWKGPSMLFLSAAGVAGIGLIVFYIFVHPKNRVISDLVPGKIPNPEEKIL